ncbi:MAG: hypothetical protein ACJAZ8_001599 [Planctomycetota bacterium]|jgi:hypothetical protein
MIRPHSTTALLFVLLACAQPALGIQEVPQVDPAIEVAPLEQEVATEQEVGSPDQSDEAPDAGDASANPGDPKMLPPLPEGVAARGGDVEVTLDELDQLLLDRHGRRPEGIDILNRLLQRAVLEELATAADIEIPDQAVGARMADLDKQLKAAGEGGLAEQLVKGDINPDVFQEMLKVSMIQAELTRIALGLEEDKQASPAQQDAWLEETLTKRGISDSTDQFPEKDTDTVAESGAAKVTLGAFKQRLHNEIGTKFVKQACTQLFFMKVLMADAGEIDSGEWSEAVDKEILRRRENHALDPQFAGTGISYESKLEAQGLTIAEMAEDTSVRVTALTTVLARREALGNAPDDLGPESTLNERIAAGMLATYRSEQDYFDGYYGMRLPLRVCMLRAVAVANELVPRSVDQATTYMTKLIPGITSEEKFVELVRKLSDEINTKKVDGNLGVYGRGDERLPAGMRSTAWEFFDKTQAPGVAGPIEVAGGVALIWVGAPIPAPNQEQLLEIVESELQRRILNGAMPETGLHVFR